jgi:hypothetical protein
MTRGPVAALAGMVLLAITTPARADKLGDAQRSLASWTGTIELAANGWTRHAVPTHYARRTLAAARHALAQPTADMAETRGSSPDAARTAEALSSVDATFARMQQLLARGDRDAMVAEVRKLQGFEQALR